MKAIKQVQIIARVQFKADPRKVIYLVRSSDGVSQYEASLFDGKVTSCSCPSHSACYHSKQIEAIEAERWIAYRQELARKLAAQFMTTQCVEQIAESLVVVMPAQEIVPPIAIELPAELRGYKKTAISTDLKGELNGAQQSAGLLMALPSRKARAS